MSSSYTNNITLIKNEILTEIFAKNNLNHTEMRIVFYIIRWSWGVDDKHNKRRRDWTKPMTISQIAKDMGISRQWCSEIINQMIRDNKIFREGRQYQFNENFEEWKVCSKN